MRVFHALTLVIASLSALGGMDTLLAGSEDMSVSADDMAREFIMLVDKEIAVIAPQYPHLSLWNKPAGRPDDRGLYRSCEGKRLFWDERELVYQHAVPAEHCRTEPTTFDSASCSVQIKVYNKREWMRVVEGEVVQEPGDDTKVFGLPIGDHMISANIMTNNPEAPKLEARVVEIIRTGLINDPPPVQ